MGIMRGTILGMLCVVLMGDRSSLASSKRRSKSSDTASRKEGSVSTSKGSASSGTEGGKSMEKSPMVRPKKIKRSKHFESSPLKDEDSREAKMNSLPDSILARDDLPICLQRNPKWTLNQMYAYITSAAALERKTERQEGVPTETYRRPLSMAIAVGNPLRAAAPRLVPLIWREVRTRAGDLGPMSLPKFTWKYNRKHATDPVTWAWRLSLSSVAVMNGSVMRVFMLMMNTMTPAFWWILRGASAPHIGGSGDAQIASPDKDFYLRVHPGGAFSYGPGLILWIANVIRITYEKETPKVDGKVFEAGNFDLPAGTWGRIVNLVGGESDGETVMIRGKPVPQPSSMLRDITSFGRIFVNLSFNGLLRWISDGVVENHTQDIEEKVHETVHGLVAKAFNYQETEGGMGFGKTYESAGEDMTFTLSCANDNAGFGGDHPVTYKKRDIAISPLSFIEHMIRYDILTETNYSFLRPSSQFTLEGLYMKIEGLNTDHMAPTPSATIRQELEGWLPRGQAPEEFAMGGHALQRGEIIYSAIAADKLSTWSGVTPSIGQWQANTVGYSFPTVWIPLETTQSRATIDASIAADPVLAALANGKPLKKWGEFIEFGGAAIQTIPGEGTNPPQYTINGRTLEPVQNPTATSPRRYEPYLSLMTAFLNVGFKIIRYIGSITKNTSSLETIDQKSSLAAYKWGTYLHGDQGRLCDEYLKDKAGRTTATGGQPRGIIVCEKSDDIIKEIVRVVMKYYGEVYVMLDAFPPAQWLIEKYKEYLASPGAYTIDPITTDEVFDNLLGQFAPAIMEQIVYDPTPQENARTVYKIKNDGKGQIPHVRDLIIDFENASERMVFDIPKPLIHLLKYHGVNWGPYPRRIMAYIRHFWSLGPAGIIWLTKFGNGIPKWPKTAGTFAKFDTSLHVHQLNPAQVVGIFLRAIHDSRDAIAKRPV